MTDVTQSLRAPPTATIAIRKPVKSKKASGSGTDAKGRKLANWTYFNAANERFIWNKLTKNNSEGSALSQCMKWIEAQEWEWKDTDTTSPYQEARNGPFVFRVSDKVRAGKQAASLCIEVHYVDPESQTSRSQKFHV